MHRLLREGVPKTQIARQLGVCRQTIYNWSKDPDDGPEPSERPSKLDPFKPYLESRLERFDIPATILMKEINEQGYTGGITILRDHVSQVKDRHVKRLVDRFETEPGRQAQVDWASCGHISHQGRRRRLSLLAVVLGYSRVIWARFVVSEKTPVLMELLEACFRDLGAVPKELLFDNMKQVVARPRAKESAAQVQAGFADFADHWGFEVMVSPPYWPRAKGKVERAIQYIKTSFLEGRSCADIDDLNGQLRSWLATEANRRVHGTTKERPVDRLGADLEAMLPIGATPAYPSVVSVCRSADHDSRISYKGVSYSVDPEIIGGRRGVEVDVLEGTDHRIRIYHADLLVGEHPLLPSGSPPQDDPRHAAKRRELRQQPSYQRPRGKAPLFDQRPPQQCQVGPVAPEVAQRPLSAYELQP